MVVGAAESFMKSILFHKKYRRWRNGHYMSLKRVLDDSLGMILK
jgi:hypothetical protein